MPDTGEWESLKCNFKIMISKMHTIVLIPIVSMRKYDNNDIGSEDFGILSLSRVMKTAKERKIVIAYDTRSPLSTGKAKTIGFSRDRRKMGANMLITKYKDFLFKINCT
jgi:hypothetical protein